MADWTLNKPEVAVYYGMFGVPKMIHEKTDGGDIVPSADNLHDKWYKTGAVAPLGSPLVKDDASTEERAVCCL